MVAVWERSLMNRAARYSAACSGLWGIDGQLPKPPYLHVLALRGIDGTLAHVKSDSRCMKHRR